MGLKRSCGVRIGTLAHYRTTLTARTTIHQVMESRGTTPLIHAKNSVNRLNYGCVGPTRPVLLMRGLSTQK